MSTRILARLIFFFFKILSVLKMFLFQELRCVLPWFRDCHFHGFVSSNVRYVTCSQGWLLSSKTNSRQENRSKLSLTASIITKYSLQHFLSICSEKKSKGLLKICKLITNLILGEIIVSNVTNVRKQNSRINYARLHWIRNKKQTSNTIITQTTRDAAPERYQVRPVTLQI